MTGFSEGFRRGVEEAAKCVEGALCQKPTECGHACVDNSIAWATAIRSLSPPAEPAGGFASDGPASDDPHAMRHFCCISCGVWFYSTSAKVRTAHACTGSPAYGTPSEERVMGESEPLVTGSPTAPESASPAGTAPSEREIRYFPNHFSEPTDGICLRCRTGIPKGSASHECQSPSEGEPYPIPPWTDFIEKVPEKCCGQATFKGTRLLVSAIVGAFRKRQAVTELWPEITSQQLCAALDYADAHPEEFVEEPDPEDHEGALALNLLAYIGELREGMRTGRLISFDAITTLEAIEEKIEAFRRRSPKPPA